MTADRGGWLSAQGGDLAAQVLAAAPEGVVVIDDHGLVVACNAAAGDLLEQPAARLIGTHVRFPGCGERPADLELTRPDGSVRVIETRSADVVLDAGRLTAVTLRDVSADRQATRDLAVTLDHQQMVAAVAAHELHGPLAALSVLAHVLRDRQSVIGAAERARLMARVLELTDRLQLLVRKLLTAGGGPAARFGSAPEPIRIREVLSQQAAEAGRPVAVSCPAALRAVTDRDDLSIMVGNYLANAVTYARPPVRVTAGPSDGWVVVRVTDGGPGVSESFVPHLFERFARDPENAAASPGLGLGLWLVRTLARDNGGDAWYESAPDGGSCFCIRLPLPPPNPQARRAATSRRARATQAVPSSQSPKGGRARQPRTTGDPP